MQGKITRYKMPGLFLVLLTSMVSMAMPADARVRPQLVVGVVIDGLDQQYLELLRDQFGPGGFNRLMREGVVIPNADYGTNVDATAASAMIMTGAAPSTTSITGNEVYDRDTQRTKPAMNDPEAMGNFTSQTLSPKALAVSTLADEVRIAGGGVGRVYSVSPDPSQAVILAGHSANAALWLNDRSGNWATSTFYQEMPAGVTQRNRMQPLAVRIDTMRWSPSRPASAYVGLPDHLTHYPFSHSFPRGSADRYDMFAASPKGNTEVTDVAGDLITDLRLGAQNVTDMVNVAYTLRPYDYTSSDDNRYELIDSYLRLDRDLERLINKAESTAGKANTLIFVAATPPSSRTRRDDEKWSIPYGEFSTKKAKSLLNMYLMAKFGNGDWVTSFHNDQFYLNDKLIESHHLDARAVRLEAAAFLEKMSGVDKVYTVDEILDGHGDPRLEALQRNTYAATGGDLFVQVAPGWETIDDIQIPARPDRVHYVKRLAAAVAPVFILAPDVDARTIDTPVDIRVVAPTVARLLRIRSPNAAGEAPLAL